MDTSPEIENAIAELTGVTGVGGLTFVADIGTAGIDEIDWILLKNDERRKVTLPRVAFTHERLGPKLNVWRLTMTARTAEIFGITDFAEQH